MAKEFSRPFYSSAAWLACRQSYIAERIKADGGLCEECRLRIGYIVHHKINIDESNVNNPEITLNHDNLQYVCKYCHDRMENHFVKGSRVEVRYVFDDFGQPYMPCSEKEN